MKNTTRTTRHDHGNCTLFPQRKAFVLRFTADAGPQTGAFRGRVEHVSSGDVSTFESPEQLWAFVRDELTTSREPRDVERRALASSETRRPVEQVRM